VALTTNWCSTPSTSAAITQCCWQGPVHTTIEDLNSTNGVFVNGKRVSRQALKEGDRVTVGRTQFRYTVRD
jgi:hypothetical protein